MWRKKSGVLGMKILDIESLVKIYRSPFLMKKSIGIDGLNMEIKEGLADTIMGRILYNDRLFTWATLITRFGPSFDIWAIRIMGVFCIGCGIFIFILFFSSLF